MQNDQKNLILAMALSLMVIVGWNYFFAQPKVQQARQTTSQLEQLGGKPADPAAPQPDLAALAPQLPPAVSRAEALAGSPRIVIDTKNLSGSIALKGARLDDLSLKAYRETIDPNSPQHRAAVALGRSGRLFHRPQLCRAARRHARPAQGGHASGRPTASA